VGRKWVEVGRPESGCVRRNVQRGGNECGRGLGFLNRTREGAGGEALGGVCCGFRRGCEIRERVEGCG